MALDEQTLEVVARDGEMDYTKWPSMIEPVLERLNHIVYNDFPIPTPYANPNRPSSPAQSKIEGGDGIHSAPTPSAPARNLPPVPLFPNSSATSTSHVPDSMPSSQSEPPSSQSNELPQSLLLLLNGIMTTLRAAFTEKPPHTIQRFAELILNPTNHYKTLPAWLRAVDRVVNVSSTADIFPLPEQALLVNGVNGDTGPILSTSTSSDSGSIRNGYDSNSLGSDESLGGALLTPIPWLRNGTQDSDEVDSTQQSNAAAEDENLGDRISIPSTSASEAISAAAAVVNTSSDPFVPERPEGAVTQGELMRMEQEAGVVPVSANPTRPLPGHADPLDDIDDLGEPVPHARGPDLVGAVDMGKVEGKNIEVRIGSPPQEEQNVPGKSEDSPTAVDEVTHEKARSGSSGGSDEDYEIVDKADEMEVDEKSTSSTGEVAVLRAENQPRGEPVEPTLSPELAEMDEDTVLVDVNEDEAAVDGEGKEA